MKKNHSPDVAEFPELVCTDRINFMNTPIKENESEGNLLKGQMSSGHSITGKILIVDNPLDLIKDYGLADKILVTKTTDPAWVFLISRCRGVIVEKGNLLSHTSIVGRELNIPIIVGVKGASSELKNGMDVTIDHVQQEVKILSFQ
ncbi:MAG: PEP-utilizing enzyme [Bacteriovoracales bacterium]